MVTFTVPCGTLVSDQTCTSEMSSFWSSRQMQGIGLALTALGGGLR
jgi:hypothetical protein